MRGYKEAPQQRVAGGATGKEDFFRPNVRPRRRVLRRGWRQLRVGGGPPMDLSALLSSEREDGAGQSRATVPPPHLVRCSPPLLQPPPLHTDGPAGPAPHLRPSHTPAGVPTLLPSAPPEDPAVPAAVAPPGMAVMPLAADGDAPTRSRPLPSLLQLGLGRDPLLPPSPPTSTWAAPTPSPAAASSCVSPFGAADLPASAPVLYMASPLGATPPVPSSLHSSPLRPLSVGGLQHGLGAAAKAEELPLGRHASGVAPAGTGGRSPPPPSPLTPLPVVAPGIGRRAGSLPGFAELSSSLGLGPSALPSVAAATDGRPDAARADWQGGAAENSQAPGARRATGLAPLPLPGPGSAYADRQDRPFVSPSPAWSGGIGGGSGLVTVASGGHLSASWSDGRSGNPLGTPPGGRSTKSSPDRRWGVEKRRDSGGGRSGDRAKAFACRLCGYRFGQKGSLHRHIAAVHERRRPYECSVCGKSTLACICIRHGCACGLPRAFSLGVASENGRLGTLDSHVGIGGERVFSSSRPCMRSCAL